MLIQLEIKNFAIIEHTIINFKDKFNVITGETGAGKSILLDALSAILGERTSKQSVRKGEEKAELKAVFLKTDHIEKKLKNLLIDLHDDVLILERQISKNGRSIAKINGSIITSQTLKEISYCIVEICSQKEQQSLLNENKYLHLIDMLSDDVHKKMVNDYKKLYIEWRRLNEELLKLSSHQREQEQLLDLYRFQINEIESAELKIDEDNELEEEKKVLSSFEKISTKIQNSINNLEIVEKIYEAYRSLQEASEYDKNLIEMTERIGKSYYELDDVKNDVSSYFDNFDYDEERLNQIMYRLEIVNNLKRKYGDTIEEIMFYHQEIKQKLDDVENKDEKLEKIKNEITIKEKKLMDLAKKMHETRINIGEQNQTKINTELKELCMPNAKFNFSFQMEKEFNSHGITKVKILFSANKGEDLQPLSKIASGGELSRVLLAMKVATKTEEMGTLIFDEVDEGVGGEVGRVIGEKLKSLGLDKQLIVISHLPQVAAKANIHYSIEKETTDTRTISKIRQLNEDERKYEIARMIYGDAKNEITLKQAEEMLKN